jgi:maltooligosyltrehalose trehalohydrolase
MPDSTVVDPSLDGRSSKFRRRLPIGVEPIGGAVSDVRVWAPVARQVDVVLEPAGAFRLAPEPDGYFSGRIPAGAGARYQFRIDGGDRLYPDPASRFQPGGPHGASQIVDPLSFRWSDTDWHGTTIDDQVVYEMHVGTFTPEGTWAAAAAQLPELARIGITMIEMMPIAEFEGRFGWGYDGVDLFAPTHLYGRPDDLRAFIDAAHRVGIAVILDVVYNHLGPVGNYLRAFAPAYFTTKYGNEWGDALNFDGADSAPVREHFIANAGYWIEEFHFDGLRLDATQQMFDASKEHILTALGRRAREAAGRRSIVLIAENEAQNVRLVRPVAEGGYGLDALWNDDFHHSAIVALTGRSEAYYSDTRGEPQEFIACAKYGYLFQGQYYHWQKQPRGTPAWNLRPANFVTFLQNHDQIANSARGLRGDRQSSPARWRAMTALLLLGPGVPMLFQGQEFGASSPFLYFADFAGDLAAAVRKGRREFLSQFPSIGEFAKREPLADPSDRSTFEQCRLDLRERDMHGDIYRLHIDLLRLRREDLAIKRHGAAGIDGAVLSSAAFVLRFFTPDHSEDRLLVVNLGADLRRSSFAEPLIAPPADADWAVAWCSEDPAYGGNGVPEILRKDGQWFVPGDSATLLAPAPRR